MRRRKILPLFCALPVILAACGDTPVAIEAGRAKMDNGGSYGSGGKAPAGDAPAASDTTTATAERAMVLPCNGGSYGSGGRNEDCPEGAN
jgi:hypothetical protein